MTDWWLKVEYGLIRQLSILTYYNTWKNHRLLINELINFPTKAILDSFRMSFHTEGLGKQIPITFTFPIGRRCEAVIGRLEIVGIVEKELPWLLQRKRGRWLSSVHPSHKKWEKEEKRGANYKRRTGNSIDRFACPGCLSKTWWTSWQFFFWPTFEFIRVQVSDVDAG